MRATTPSDPQQAGALLGRDPASVRKRVEGMENMLEGLFVIPGTNMRVGLDALLGVLPVGGSVIAAAMGSWLAWEARNLKIIRSWLDKNHPRTVTLDIGTHDTRGPR